MTRTRSTGGLTPVVVSQPKDKVMIRIGVRRAKTEEVAPPNQPGKDEYELLLKEVKRQRDEIVNLKELADPTEINRLIDKAEGMVKEPPQFLAAKRELEKVGPICVGQKKAAEEKKADKTEFNRLLPLARQAAKTVTAPADPTPLTELILASEGLGERGHYAAAVAKIKTYEKLVLELKKKGGEEPGKQVEYTKQLQLVTKAVEQLTTGELKDFGDPDPLQNLLDAAKLHADAGRFASAVEALGDHAKIAKAQLAAARQKKKEKEEYETRNDRCRQLISEAKVTLPAKGGMPQTEVNCATELYVLATAAGHLAVAGQYAEASQTLANVETVGAQAIKDKDANVVAVAQHAGKLQNAKDKVALLHPPLADVEPLQKIIFDAERLAEKSQYAAAVKLLDGANKEFAKQEKLEKKRGPLQKQYQTALGEAETLLTNLRKVPLADAEPLEQLVTLAKGLADGGNFELAAKTLERAATLSKEETEKAKGQGQAKGAFETQFKLAEAALTKLLKLGDLADPKALQAMVDLGRNLGAGGKYASALAAIKNWQTEAESRTTEAERRGQAKGVYDGKLRETQTKADKLDVPRYQELIASGVTTAEGQALAGRYDEAVATLDKQLEAIASFTQKAEEQKGLRADYERELQAAQQRIKDLESRDRATDADLIQAQGLVEKATRAAAEGGFAMALKYVGGMKTCLDKAELAADKDDQNKTLYLTEKAEADYERDALLKLGDKATVEPLAQMIDVAEAKAQRGLYTAAYELLKTHTDKFNELVKLQRAEGDKKSETKYGVQLKTAEGHLLDLQKTPHAEATEMEALIAQAKNEAKAGKFASACNTLTEAERVFSEQTQLAKTADEKEKQIAKAKIKFDSRRQQVEKLLGELLSCPGTEETVAKIREDLRIADAAAKKDDYRTGQKRFIDTIKVATEAKKKSGEALDEVGKTSGVVSKDYGNIKKLSGKDEKAIGAAGNDFKVARGSAEAALNSYREVAPPQRVQEFEKRIVAANSQVLAAKKETTAAAGLKLMNAGIAELNKIALEITAATTPVTGARTDCGTLSEKLRLDLQRLWLTARADEVQPLQVRFDKLQMLLSAKEFELAKTKLEALDKDIEAKTGAITKDMTDWANAEKEIPGINNAIKIYLQDALLKTSAMELMNQLATITQVLVKKDKNYRQAVEEFGYVKDQLGHFEGSRQQVTEFASTRATADKEVKAADGKIGEALTQLQTAMKKADPKGQERTPAGLAAERQSIMDAWALRATTAPDEATLNKAGALKALRTLAGKIADLAKDPAAANTAIDEEAAAGEFEKARAAADKALDPVRARGGDQAAALEKEFAAFVKSAPDDYAKATLGMNDLKTRAEQLVGRLDKERLEAVVKARARAATALEEIAALQKGLKQWFPTSSDLGTEFAKFFEEQAKLVAALEGLRESGNLKAIASADKELNEIMSRTRAAAADARSTTVGGSSFKTVLERRKAIEDKLKNPALKACTPAALEKLDKEFKKLSEKTKAQEPSEAMAALIQFEESVTPAIQAAERAKTLRAEIKTKTTEALTALKAIKDAAPEYYDKLLKQVKKAKKDGKTEKGEQPALTLLGTLKADIDKAVLLAKDKPSELAGKEKGAKNEKAVLDNAKLTWESSLSVFERTALPAATQAVSKHPEGDATQLDDLKKLRDKAQEAAKAGDYLGATKQIQTATKVAERVQAAPQGVKATSRDNLPRVEDGWRKAVGAVKEGIDKVKKALSELAKTEAIKELVTINRALDQLEREAFDPNAFGDVVKVLSAKGNKPAERRAARELALRTVREYRATIKDPVLGVLFKANPFAKVPLNQINASLDDLDLNIQRSV